MKAAEQADSVQIKALRIAWRISGAAGAGEVASLLETSAAHLHDPTTGGVSGAYLVVREARRLAAVHRSPPHAYAALLDALDVTLAVLTTVAQPEPSAAPAAPQRKLYDLKAGDPVTVDMVCRDASCTITGDHVHVKAPAASPPAAQPSADAIVRALAAVHQAAITDEVGSCTLCSARTDPYADDTDHTASCAWTLAKKWVEAADVR